MKTTVSLSTVLIAASLGLSVAQPSFADAPNIQTVGPIIHLADNLGEEATLGWCIDTEGADTGLIKSATYEDMCMVYSAPDDAENPFGLIACDEADEAQRFAYNDTSMEIRLGLDASQCVTVAETIDDAGPFQSRDLILARCDELDPGFKQWVIRE